MDRSDNKSNTNKKRSRNSRKNTGGTNTRTNSRNQHKSKKNREQRYVLTPEDLATREAIKAHKMNKPECPMCKKPIDIISSCLSDRETGLPVHFDCVLKYLESQEKLLPGQKINYLGQGRFAVVHFENPRDLRRFKIIKIIEWEKKEERQDWRSEIASLYSQVH